MQFRRNRGHRRSVEMNLVPLIDLFLNILVFFVVATTFASSDSLFVVDLPEVSASGGTGERQSATVTLNSAGEIALDRKKVTIDELRGELDRIPTEKRAAFPVILRADRGALHGRVVMVLDTIRFSGFQTVGIATQAVSK